LYPPELQQMHDENLHCGFKCTRASYSLNCILSHSLSFLLATALLDELSWALWEEEHLPNVFPSEQQLLSLLDNFPDFLCPDDKSWKTCTKQNLNPTINCCVQYCYCNAYRNGWFSIKQWAAVCSQHSCNGVTTKP